MNQKTSSKKNLLPIISTIVLILFGLSIHLYRLVTFPVFADEAIYIRWAQLIMDDWQRYLFFPLNDGKTPLFIWVLVPFQYLFRDQLMAARSVAVVIGTFQVLVMKKLLAKLGATPKFQWFGALLTFILPFWYFQAHVSLMDGLLTLFLSLTILGGFSILEYAEKKKPQKLFLWTVLTGIFFGMAFWTKLPALFLSPIFPLLALFPPKFSKEKRVQLLFPLVGAAFLGGVIFVFLRISPAFGQLFHRGNDFAYPVSEVLFQNKWKETLANIPSYFIYFLIYLTPGIILLSLSGMFSNRSRRQTTLLLSAAILFAAPLVIFGKVIYARYLFPSSIFITLAAVLNLQALYQHWIVETTSKQLTAKLAAGLVMALLLANTISTSFIFIQRMLFHPDTVPFASSDRAQYLEDWSSGQGIWETTQYIKHQAKEHSIAVATEGRFGTLPDGLLLYFHNEDVKNIYIEGTGQYPVKSLPDFFVIRAKNFDQSILVVNSDRMELPLPASKLLGQYCRPHNKSCLQIWDITDQVRSARPLSSR